MKNNEHFEMLKIKHKIIIYILSILLITSVSNGAIISGIVTDSLTNKPLPGVNIYFDIKNKKGVSTGIDGKFIIREIHSGEYELKIQMMGYYTKHVSVTINSNSDSLFISIPIHWGYKIDCDTSYYSYQKELKRELESNYKGLEFIINKCHIDRNILVQVKIKNNLSLPIYIPKNFRCIPVYKALLMDENNHILESNDVVDMGCDIPYKFKYDYSDIIAINPKKEKIIDTIRVWQYNLKELKDKNIKLKLLYNFNIDKPLKSGLTSNDNFPTKEDENELRNIYCKILNGPFETNWKIIEIK